MLSRQVHLVGGQIGGVVVVGVVVRDPVDVIEDCVPANDLFYLVRRVDTASLSKYNSALRVGGPPCVVEYHIVLDGTVVAAVDLDP